MTKNKILSDFVKNLDSAASGSFLFATSDSDRSQARPLLTTDVENVVAPYDSAGVISLIDSSFLATKLGFDSVGAPESFIDSDANAVVSAMNTNVILDSSGTLGTPTKKWKNIYTKKLSFGGAYIDENGIDGGNATLTTFTLPGDYSFTQPTIPNLGVPAIIPETITNSEYTTMLLKTDNTQSDAQVDGSTNGLSITQYGNATSTAFTPYHPKGYSTYFDGTSDYLVIDDTAIQTMSSSGFCFEMWVYGVPNGSFLTWNVGSGVDGFYIGNAGGVYLSSNSSSWDVFSGVPIGLTANQWNHVALTWDTTTYRYLVNGSVVASTANSTAMSSSGTAKLGVGATATGNVECTNEFYVRDLRFTNGDAVYTGSYTVPSEPLTADGNTALLVCSEPYLKDVSGNDCSITINTAIEQRLFSPYEHSSYTKSSHGGSVHFDGTGDYLTVPSDAGFAFGTGDFTVEGWVYRTATPTYSHFVDFRGSNNNGYNPVFFWKNNLIHYTNDNTSGEIQIQSSNAIGVGVWAHLAIVRSSNTLTVYVNGTDSGSLSYTTNVLGGNTVFIGNRFTNTLPHNGYISDFRIVSSAVYTSDFTPPTGPLTAISNTQLLTCTNKHEVWDAASGDRLTLYGDTDASTTQSKYSGSSIYFDGTGDYLKTSSSDQFTIGTGDFTIELWMRVTGGSSYRQLFSFRASNGAAVNYGSLAVNPNSGYTWYTSSSVIDTSSSWSSDTWYHVALVRSGGTLALYQDGTSLSSVTFTQDLAGTTLSVAANNDGSETFTGYIEDFRYTKGLARYTSTFTPPTAELEG